jgi:HAD superfamily hydrolase (TIGR01509 family)
MTLRAVMFDHDGTLVDSERIHYEMWVQILADHGHDLPESQYKAVYAGMPTPANAADMVRRFGIAASVDQLIESKNSATQAYLSQRAFPLMPRAREVIVELYEAGLKLAVVTGASASGVHVTLRANNLEGYWTTIVSGDDVRRSKPAPDCYLLALERLGVGPAECLAIEDTQYGVEAAHGAGISSVAVPSDMSSHQDFRHASAILGNMSELGDYLRDRRVRR